MRVAFFMTHAGHARNFEWVLRDLLARGHDVHVVCDERPAGGERTSTLDTLAASSPRLTLSVRRSRTRPRGARWSARLRVVIDYLGHLEREGNGHALRARAGARIPAAVRRVLEADPISAARVPRRLRRWLAGIERRVPSERSVVPLVRALRPDVMLVVPLLETGSPQVGYVRAGRRLGVPTCASISSWDNLTTKGLIAEVPDAFAVWNEAHAREAVEHHAVPTRAIAVTGAVPLDHWFAWKPATDRTAFCERHGLDPAVPIVLYVASSAFVAADEADHARRCVDAVRARFAADGRRVQFLLRPHPLNPLADPGDARDRLDAMPDVVVHPPHGENPASDEARMEYLEAVHHCAAVVGINTSAFLEAAIVDRPVHSALVARYRPTQLGLPHFHHLPADNGGPLITSCGYAELARRVQGTVDDPSAASELNRRFVDAFIRPRGHDVVASSELVDLLERLADQGPSASSPSSAMARALTSMAMSNR